MKRVTMSIHKISKPLKYIMDLFDIIYNFYINTFMIGPTLVEKNGIEEKNYLIILISNVSF